MRLHLHPIQTRLLRALHAAIAADEMLGALAVPPTDSLPRLVIEGTDCMPWHSLTFSGHRHHLALRLIAAPSLVEHALARLETLLDGITIQGQEILIDAGIEEVRCGIEMDGDARLELTIAALTIQE